MNILVTGGTSGLGKAIVERIAADPVNNVYFTYSKSTDTAQFLNSSYLNSKAFHCDFEDSESVDRFISILQDYDVDILINNAVTGYNKQHFHKAVIALFENSFVNNVIPVLKITQCCLIKFRKKKFGKIINIISSAVVNKPPVGWSEYVANKSYLLSMSKSWATENVSYNITSNSISPTFMVTRLTSLEDERIIEEMIQKHPLKRLLLVEEVADSVAFLVSSSQQINGQNFLINAGVDVI